MATPRLGLVVEDKPTELSCTCTYNIPCFRTPRSAPSVSVVCLRGVPGSPA